MSTILKIGIAVGTTRPGRVGRAVGEWVLRLAASRSGNVDVDAREDRP